MLRSEFREEVQVWDRVGSGTQHSSCDLYVLVVGASAGIITAKCAQ